jgi:hypothetical protein
MVVAKRVSTVRRERPTLRINLAKVWTTTEFAELFSEFEMLNKIAALGELIEDRGGLIPFESRHTRQARFWSNDPFEEFEIKELLDDVYLREFLLFMMPVPSPLQVTQIEYASPGFTDLTGVGRTVAGITKFVLGITDRFLAIEDRALAREEKSQKILVVSA